MSDGTEIESKYLVRDLQRLAARLAALDARIVQPRTYERNIRFDQPDGSLRLAKKVLRLREDDKARLTFKGPGEAQDGIYTREELEVEVSDFDSMQSILQSLGYAQFAFYEKFRTTYAFKQCLIMLDEMPYGNFVEVEGPNALSVTAVSEMLGLDTTLSLCDSYLGLFERVRAQLGLTFSDLSFKNFQGVAIPPAAFGKDFAD